MKPPNAPRVNVLRLFILVVPVAWCACEASSPEALGVARPDEGVSTSSGETSAVGSNDPAADGSTDALTAVSSGISSAVSNATGSEALDTTTERLAVSSDSQGVQSGPDSGRIDSSDATSEPPSSDVEFADGEQAVMQLAVAFCAAARACCVEFPGTSLDDCETRYLTKWWAAEGVSRGTTGAKVAELNRCLEAFSKSTEDCDRTRVIDACAGAIEGRQPLGASCSALGLDCQYDNNVSQCLVTESQSEEGECVATPRGAAGDKCMGTCQTGQMCSVTVYGLPQGGPDAYCHEADGLYCDFTEDVPQCKPMLPDGAVCISGIECASRSACNWSTEQPDVTTCQPYAMAGQSCASAVCGPNLLCIDNTCQQQPFADEWTCTVEYPLGP